MHYDSSGLDDMISEVHEPKCDCESCGDTRFGRGDKSLPIDELHGEQWDALLLRKLINKSNISPVVTVAGVEAMSVEEYDDLFCGRQDELLEQLRPLLDGSAAYLGIYRKPAEELCELLGWETYFDK